MASGTLSGVRIAGIASAVPRERRTPDSSAELLGLENVSKIGQGFGVQTRRVVPLHLRSLFRGGNQASEGTRLVAQRGAPA
jgi:hypothetical protein